MEAFGKDKKFLKKRKKLNDLISGRFRGLRKF